MQEEHHSRKNAGRLDNPAHCLHPVFTIPFFFFFFFCFGSSLLCAAFSSCGERGLLFVVVHGLLTAVASLVAEHGL